MNLLDILHEIDDQIGSNTKSLKENPPVVITVTDIPKAVAALKNIENYSWANASKTFYSILFKY